MNRIARFIFLTSTGFSLWGQSYTISTVAGGGLPPYPAPALNTSISYTGGVAVDSGGNLYVSNPTLSVVLKVDTSGVATLFAGTGVAGYSGDGGAAISAEMNTPTGLAFDPQGNLLIADALNHAIRKVSLSGTITTLAGTGTSGYSGDGGPATQATLYHPDDVASDVSGNVYIADSFNGVIRMIDTSGTITTFAGNHLNGYSGDGGPATAASMTAPQSVAVDATATCISRTRRTT